MFQPSQPLVIAPSAQAEVIAGWSDASTSAQVASAKRAFTTRGVKFDGPVVLITDRSPQAGDLVLARVTSLGHHQKLELPDGRRAQMYEDDLIFVAYGERYAPDQFEAVIPEHLGPCDLVASGGVAGKVLSRHARARQPTTIRPLGLLANAAGEVLNLSRFSLPKRALPAKRPRVIAVAGTSMNAGKTTAAAALIHGLTRAGLHVAAAKVTGTGSGNDYWSMLDAGARQVLDFTDMGYASTAGLSPETVERTALSLTAHCASNAPDVIVLEVADGLLQRETATLLSSGAFRNAVDGVLFAAADAISALSGRQWLMDHGHPVVGVSGLITASPLASREAGSAIGEPLVTVAELRDPTRARTLAWATNRTSRNLRVCG